MNPLTIWLPVLRSGSGADVFTMRLARGLEQAGHQPILQWFDRRFELFPSLLKRVRPPESIDLVHSNSWQGFAFKRIGVPLVVTEHHSSLHPWLRAYHSKTQALYHHWCVHRWNRLSYRVAQAVVAVSHFCAEPLYAEAKDRVKVIHNGVDIKHFSPDENCQADSPHQPFRLLFVGNPSRWKGVDILMPLALALGPDYEIQCLGGLRHGYSSDSKGRLHYLPKTPPDKMPLIYRSVDALVVPTRFENFSYVVLEAMACGIPVLGFDRAGTAEQCVHGETALLCQVDDIDALAANTRLLAHDQDLYTRLSMNARQRVVNFFSEEACTMAYIDLYKKLLSQEQNQ
jgi:glycosyltransferase involved in cell wall biosynthesis